MPEWRGRFEAFLFDMDGVLTDSMPNHWEAWQKVFADLGVIVDREEILRREGEKGMVTLKSVLERSGVRTSPEVLAQALERKEHLFRSFPKPALLPGARELVHELWQSGARVALVTGTSLNEARSNLPADLFEKFDTVVTGDQIDHGKPDPEPYQVALERLGVQKTRALVIENAPFGIASAKGAGLTCIALTTSLPAAELAGADWVATSLHELREILLGVPRPNVR